MEKVGSLPRSMLSGRASQVQSVSLLSTQLFIGHCTLHSCAGFADCLHPTVHLHLQSMVLISAVFGEMTVALCPPLQVEVLVAEDKQSGPSSLDAGHGCLNMWRSKHSQPHYQQLKTPEQLTKVIRPLHSPSANGNSPSSVHNFNRMKQVA